MAAVLLWLFSVGALLVASDAQKAYNSLPETYKKGVDLALKKVNSFPGIQQHFLFFKSVKESTLELGFDVSYIHQHFYLKATACQRGTVDSTGCRFRNDRPLIDCQVCFKTFGGAIEEEPEPYVHCVHRPALTEEMMTTREEQCRSLQYNSGSATLMASIGNE